MAIVSIDRSNDSVTWLVSIDRSNDGVTWL